MSTSKCESCDRVFDNDTDPQCRDVPYYDDGTTILLCEDCREKYGIPAEDD